MRLLLIEDDHELVKELKPELQQAGYTVDIAENGIDGEFLGSEGIYDIAILDLGLPQRNGLEVLSNWRSNNNALPVIILTGRDTWHERVNGFKLGADDYLGKPFHSEELLARITALLYRTRQQIPGKRLHSKQFSLDEERQLIIKSDGSEHSLTATEYRLIRYFLLNPNQILSKAKLLDTIYDLDSDKDSNVIEVYIRRIRQILGKHSIETRRNQGYLFRGY